MTASIVVEALHSAVFEPRQRFVQCASPAGLHRMAYAEWGDPANPRVLLCVHGLTRSGCDFDALVRMFATDYRVVCPDVVGRAACRTGSPIRATTACRNTSRTWSR